MAFKRSGVRSSLAPQIFLFGDRLEPLTIETLLLSSNQNYFAVCKMIPAANTNQTLLEWWNWYTRWSQKPVGATP